MPSNSCIEGTAQAPHDDKNSNVHAHDDGRLEMSWKPISRDSLDAIIAADLANATPAQRAVFDAAAVSPLKWQLSPWGDAGGGFWVIAVTGDRVLWYNDIEDGFNVSRFTAPGVIPSTEYWCNQDELLVALPTLVGAAHAGLAPPEPLL